MRRLLLAACLALPTLAGLGAAAARPPNVILILTDNHGDWTLGCYGNKDIRTPHLDRLAAEGVRFANAFANNPVCSPNRATLLTGLMPSQHGIHCFLRAGFPQIGRDAYCTIAEFPTLPKILKSRGYACGLVGKWHLGANLAPQEGFTEEWVTMPHGASPTFFDAEVIENGAIRREPMHLTQFWTKRALRFIEKQRDRPFFLYLCYNGPYGLGAAQLKDCERAPHWNDYADKDLPSFPRAQMHPWQHDNKAYLNNITCIRRYAAEVSTIDDGVGEIMARLKTLGLDENTVVIFTGDNGWSGGQNGLWGMGDHTRPLTAYDAQMRVPLIWRHPSSIPAAQVSPIHVSHVNMLPSLLDHLGFETDKPPGTALTGRSYAPVLRGAKMGDWHDAVFYEFENLRCIREPAAKLIERTGGDPSEYFRLDADPGEKKNLWPDPRMRDQQARLRSFFEKSADPRFDLWRGGKSKAKALVFPRAE